VFGGGAVSTVNIAIEDICRNALPYGTISFGSASFLRCWIVVSSLIPEVLRFVAGQ
jgi:hypothetical protein